MTTHEILVGARNLIARDGWWKLGNGCGKYETCAALAIDRVATGVGIWPHPTLTAFASAVGLEDDPLAIYQWNDSRSDVTEVFAGFDKAIAATAPPPPEFDLKVPDHIAIVVEDIHARR